MGLNYIDLALLLRSNEKFNTIEFDINFKRTKVLLSLQLATLRLETWKQL
jgi:hypothetical protein